MKINLFSKVLPCALLSVIMLTACTGGQEEPYPTPVAPTSTPVTEASPEPSVAPSENTVPKPQATLDTSTFTVSKVKGLTDEDIKDILDISEKFAIQGFHAKYLNGSWSDFTVKELAEEFSPYITPSVLAALESIKIDDPESANSLASIAALFTPTNKIKATELCVDAMVIEDCLRSNLVFSEPKMTLEGRATITFNVSSTRDLLLNDKPAESKVTINYSLTLSNDNDAWLIDGINNTFSYGKVEEV